MTAPTPVTWPTTSLCPATGNLPTRMLPGSWRTLCASYQRREAVGANRGKGGMAPEDFAAISAARFPCAVCAGRALPPGLELITQEEVSEMARTTKRGVCELCGAHANIGVNHGSKVCPSCTHIQSALNKRVEVVAKAARAMHKTEELLGHLIPAGELAVHVTADMLQEISGIVGYDGEDPGELVEAVRRRVLACASCDAEDVLHEIREIVGYSPERGDKGLADAVRRMALRDASSSCADCTTLREDLDRSTRVIEELRAELTLAEQARDEWEQRAVQAEGNIEALEAELKEAESRNGRLQYQLAGYAPEPSLGHCCTDSGLLDIALRALRGEGPDADQLAVLIDAARRAA